MDGTKEPTFFLAGAQRSGTTWLYHVLDEHPQIFMAKPLRPEPKFFLDPTIGRVDRERYLQRWFSDVGDEIAVGEKSASYMEAAGVPERMKRFFPDAKILFLLRHPIERAISNYRFSRSHGLESESLEYALTHEEQRIREIEFSQISVHPFAYLRRGHYVRDIARFLNVFPRKQIKVLLLEDFQEDPSGTIADLFAYLGVDTGVHPAALQTSFNETPEDDLTIDRAVLDSLLRQYEPSNRALEDLVGCDVRRWGRLPESLLAMQKQS